MAWICRMSVWLRNIQRMGRDWPVVHSWHRRAGWFWTRSWQWWCSAWCPHLTRGAHCKKHTARIQSWTGKAGHTQNEWMTNDGKNAWMTKWQTKWMDDKRQAKWMDDKRLTKGIGWQMTDKTHSRQNAWMTNNRHNAWMTNNRHNAWMTNNRQSGWMTNNRQSAWMTNNKVHGWQTDKMHGWQTTDKMHGWQTTDKVHGWRTVTLMLPLLTEVYCSGENTPVWANAVPHIIKNHKLFKNIRHWRTFFDLNLKKSKQLLWGLVTCASGRWARLMASWANGD